MRDKSVTPSIQLQTLIKRRVKIRLIFATIIWVLYAIFALGYGPLKSYFVISVSSGAQIPFALLYFISLIIIFIALEFLYMQFAKKSDLLIREGAEKEGYNCE